jgi:hypothetical protein
MSRKIALVGTCPSGQLATQLPDDWECWVCSPGNDGFPRIDLWFELHGDLDFPGENWWPYLNWLNMQRFPVMVNRIDLIPRGLLFPIDQAVSIFSDYFFSCQPALMFAYALMQEGVSDIGLFGLDMQARSEYQLQKPCMLHFAWLAGQRGIRVLAPPESEALISPPIYGYNLMSPMARKLRVRQMEAAAEIRKLDEQIRTAELRRAHFRGVADDNDWTMQTWTGGVYRETAEVVRIGPRRVNEKE